MRKQPETQRRLLSVAFTADTTCTGACVACDVRAVCVWRARACVVCGVHAVYVCMGNAIVGARGLGGIVYACPAGVCFHTTDIDVGG